MVIGSGPRTTRIAVGQHDGGGREAGRALVDIGDDGEATPALAGVLHHRDGDRADEHVVLGPGVLPGGLLQLPDQGIEEALEPVEVAWAKGGRRRRWAR